MQTSDGGSSIRPHENGQHNHEASGKRKFAHKILTMLGLRKSPTLKESLEEVIEEHEESVDPAAAEDTSMLRNVLEFGELNVGDVMIPRTDIVTVSHDISLDELKSIVITSGHTRLPVYRGNLDDVAGFLHVKDLVPVLGNGRNFKMDDMLRRILVVPPSMRVTNLLVKMRMSHTHMAIVVDEYGGTSGLVTMEDLVEEIFGEIEDEHDTIEREYFVDKGDGIYKASARMDIRELEERLQLKLRSEDEDEFDTLGGMIFNMLGHVPTIGEVAVHSAGLEFEIIEADPRRIKRVLIRQKTDEEVAV